MSEEHGAKAHGGHLRCVTARMEERHGNEAQQQTGNKGFHGALETTLSENEKGGKAKLKEIPLVDDGRFSESRRPHRKHEKKAWCKKIKDKRALSFMAFFFCLPVAN